MNNEATYHRGLHYFAVAVAACTVFLIFVGGMVTSTDSGLAVPDWPLSYGRLMPPMIGGIFYEHGHRMVASAVGFLTIILAVLAQRVEKRAWVRKMAWTALGLVVVQGLFGGLTVYLRLPKLVSITHACLAQTFMSLTFAIAVWTSRAWHTLSTTPEDPSPRWPLHHLAAALFGATYVQLILGAILRHTGWGVIPHISGALVVFTLISVAFKRTRAGQPASIKRFATLAYSFVWLQIILGITTYFIISHDFDTIPEPLFAPISVSSHVVTGALVLGLSVVLALLSYRSRPLKTPPIKARMADYFELTKPGISLMAGITALAGFVMGSRGHLNFIELLHTGVGTLLLASGACTLNMLIEKDVDARMKRTEKRPLPAGRLAPGEALFLGSLLCAVALIYFALAVNALTAVVAAITMSVYLYVYTPLKKVSSLCTTAGSVAGALPPVIGWTAATGHFGIECWVLFGILFFWQFPHFFALAWLYKDDYERGGLHMLPQPQDQGRMTAWSMLLNSVALLIVSMLPTFLGLTGYIYLSVAVLTGLWMSGTSLAFLITRTRASAKQTFFASLAYVPLIVTAMVLNKWPLSK